MPETRVIHLKDAPEGWQSDPNYVYIGRAVPRKRLRASIFANPFSVGKSRTREEAIASYKVLVWPHNENTGEPFGPLPEWWKTTPKAKQIAALHGKTLVCWCAPKPCHGEVLVRLAAELNGIKLCAKCLRVATRQMGIPDPDLPMIPLCASDLCKAKLYIELTDGARRIG